MGSFLAVDAGASNTRFITKKGEVRVLPNNMHFMPMDEMSKLNPMSTNIEDCLEAYITKVGDSQSDMFPLHVLLGNMAKRKSSYNSRPSSTVAKYAQRENIVSVVMAAAVAHLENDLPKNFNLYMALPPVEVVASSDKVKETFKGVYEVKLPKYMGGVELTLNIPDVFPYEESQLAIVSFFFTKDAKLRQENIKFGKGRLLSIDIGASTTDLYVAENRRQIEASGRTLKVGGNVALDRLSMLIMQQFQYEPPIEDVEQAMMTGQLECNGVMNDVSALVTSAKDYLAETVVNKTIPYFQTSDMAIQSISAVMVSGGGSMESQYIDDETKQTVTTVGSVSALIMEKFQKYAPKLVAVSHSDAPRYANIDGLYVRAMLDEQVRDKQREAATASASVVEPTPTPVIVAEPAQVTE